MNRFVAAAFACVLAVPALAEGDAAKGEKGFNKCKSCHMIETPAGETIVKGGKTGPNLYGVVGRAAGTYEGYKYGDSLVAAGEKGLVWDEESFVAFTQDPKSFLNTYLGETAAKSKMTFKLKSGGEDVFAYLQSVAAE
ncbi:cytochrome C [Ruegeria pomeroyi]|uniref:Cytochrome C n=1 Tax=Ruegeria pomeroyi TaxID=89184 RepID=A0A9Q3ZPP3_9RHOB|nr:cytochrome C [Ruegeria pomeroyi]MCE8518487.1 cytochrome C [Ruegeria pomeroyi]MCE8538889.1 cytochrome C [Ruegeria pomeroyi]MCE8552921.1 cytochrome C [Ruegeria pomeroyi]